MCQHLFRANRVCAFTFIFAILSGCASLSSREQAQNTEPAKGVSINDKIAAEPPAIGPEAIAQRAAEVFSSAEGLTAAQRKELMAIYLRTYKDASAIRIEIGKSKSLLFKIVSAKSYNSAEVEMIKKKVVDLDQKRLALMFKSLADVQLVVGIGSDKEQLYQHFFDYEYPRYENLSQRQ